MRATSRQRFITLPHDRLKNTFLYYYGFIVLGLVVSISGPALSSLASHTGATLERISVIFLSASLGNMLGSTIGGWLIDRVRGHRLLAMCAIVFASLFALVPLMSNLYLLIALFFLFSAIQIMVDVGSNTLIVWTHGDSVAPYMNGLHFAFGFGGFFAPLLVAHSIIWTGEIHWAFWVIAMMTIPFAFAVWRIPSPSRQSKILQKVSSDHQSAKTTNKFLVVMVGLVFFFMAGVEATVFGWSFNYGVAIGMDKLTTAASFTSAMWAAFSLSRLLSIPISTRLSLRATMYWVLIGMAVSAALFVVGGDAQIMAWLAICGIGFFVAPIFPTALSYLGSRISITGKLTSFIFIMANLGSMIFPFLAGQLFEPIGVFTLRWMLFILSTLCLAVFVALDQTSAR
jgi:FHS family Na+ dependent glucose MFS transporter 1